MPLAADTGTSPPKPGKSKKKAGSGGKTGVSVSVMPSRQAGPMQMLTTMLSSMNEAQIVQQQKQQKENMEFQQTQQANMLKFFAEQQQARRDTHVQTLGLISGMHQQNQAFTAALLERLTGGAMGAAMGMGMGGGAAPSMGMGGGAAPSMGMGGGAAPGMGMAMGMGASAAQGMGMGTSPTMGMGGMGVGYVSPAARTPPGVTPSGMGSMGFVQNAVPMMRSNLGGAVGSGADGHVGGTQVVPQTQDHNMQ